MDSDEEYNSSEELQPRTSLQPKPAPFSHAPFKSGVPDVSLVFINAEKQPIIESPPIATKSNSDGFESYNAWRQNNLKTCDRSSPRLKYYATSPRYVNDATPLKTSCDERENFTTPLSKRDQLPYDNVQKDLCQLPKPNTTEDSRYGPPSVNQEFRQDINHAYPGHSQRYQNSQTFQEQFLPSTCLPFPGLQCSQQANQRSPDPLRRFDQNISYQNQTMPSNFTQSQIRNTNLAQHSPNLHHQESVSHVKSNAPDFDCNSRMARHESVNHVMSNAPDFDCNSRMARHESVSHVMSNVPQADNSFDCNSRISSHEQFNCNKCKHNGQGDCHTLSVKTEKEQGISFTELYKLIQMQNEEIQGLRAQVQGLLEQSIQPALENNHSKEMSRLDSDCQIAKQINQHSNSCCCCQTNGNATCHKLPSCGNASCHKLPSRGNASCHKLPNRGNVPGERCFQQANGSDHRTMGIQHSNYASIENKNPNRCEHSTNLTAQGQWTNENQTNDVFKKNETSSAIVQENNQPIECQTRSMVQQVSIGVMTSFVDHKVYYQRPVERRVPRPNALLRQATAGNMVERNAMPTNLKSETVSSMKQPISREHETLTHSRATSHNQHDSHDNNGRSLSPPGERRARRQPTRSPDASMHVDVQDFRSDSSSCSSGDQDDPTRVGWTFYHNMVGQVNDMLDDGLQQDVLSKPSKKPGFMEANGRDRDLVREEYYDNRPPSGDQTGETRLQEHDHRGGNVVESNDGLNRYELERQGMGLGWDNTAMGQPWGCQTSHVATMRQLQTLGVENDNSVLAASKKVTFDSVYFMPRIGSASRARGPSDISMHMDALAMKYFEKDCIDQYPMPSGKDTDGFHQQRVYDLTNKVCNMSMATMKYLERYQLLPKNTHSPFGNQREPKRHQAIFNQTTIPPNKILDITALKEQPKFI